ncbi:MAG: Spy/CpxP family protein refolding chaperone [Chromatiales bacterium]|nr:Spy/CpxP family protein refolding chaperone [Chromatiales bacterium]
MRRGMDTRHGRMMDDPDPMRGMPDELALSDEQRETMRGIQRDLRRQTWDAQGKLIDEQERLHDLWRANPRDPQAIGEAYARMQQIQRPIIEARVKAMNAVEAALTDAQRETLRDLHRRQGSGMSGMGMHGMGMHGHGGGAMGMHGGRCPMQGGMR